VVIRSSAFAGCRIASLPKRRHCCDIRDWEEDAFEGCDLDGSGTAACTCSIS